jgi:hypothetical protein
MDNTLFSFDLTSVTNLTITSVLYNPTSHVSDWVDKIFGSKAIINKKNDYGYNLGPRPLTDSEIVDRYIRFKRNFALPHYALWPACSLEFLGFVANSEDGQFSPSIRYGAFVGNATVVIKERSIDWRCFYRPVYENWREEKNYSKPNYWGVIFFCPSPNSTECSNLEQSMLNTSDFEAPYRHSLNESGIVSLTTPAGDEWRTGFLSRPFISKDERYTTFDQSYNTQNNGQPHNVSGYVMAKAKSAHAVCLSIPYTSTDTAKASANGAILLEWIRYYSSIGFKVLVYDRDGANYQHIFNSSYGVSQNIRIPRGKLVYHPYTIRGLLDASRKGLTYDNTEAEILNDKQADDQRRGRFESQGHDKVQTLTHCRFEAKALYNIDTVLVVDYDEFLYCPVVPPTARAQGGWINNLLSHMKAIGVSQLEFTQRVVLNKTESPRNCVVDKASKGESIFDCFSSYVYYNGAHSLKSAHLDHSCPLTGYHNACPSDHSPRSHDCLCHTRLMKSNNWRPFENRRGRECALVHLSTNIASYGRPEYAFSDEETAEALKSRLEIGTLLNSRKKGKGT